MWLAGAAAPPDSGGSTGLTVGLGLSTAVAILVALIGSPKIRLFRRHRPIVIPAPPPITAADSAANINLLNLQNILNTDRTNFEIFRTETETRFNRLYQELQHRDEVIQIIEEDLAAQQQFCINIMTGVLKTDMPPFPPMPIRRARPPRPVVT
jgi:hypothetical protein